METPDSKRSPPKSGWKDAIFGLWTGKKKSPSSSGPPHPQMDRLELRTPAATPSTAVAAAPMPSAAAHSYSPISPWAPQSSASARATSTAAPYARPGTSAASALASSSVANSRALVPPSQTSVSRRRPRYSSSALNVGRGSGPGSSLPPAVRESLQNVRDTALLIPQPESFKPRRMHVGRVRPQVHAPTRITLEKKHKLLLEQEEYDHDEGRYQKRQRLTINNDNERQKPPNAHAREYTVALTTSTGSADKPRLQPDEDEEDPIHLLPPQHELPPTGVFVFYGDEKPKENNAGMSVVQRTKAEMPQLQLPRTCAAKTDVMETTKDFHTTKKKKQAKEEKKTGQARSAPPTPTAAGAQPTKKSKVDIWNVSHAGKWKCQVCSVWNKNEDNKCVSCENQRGAAAVRAHQDAAAAPPATIAPAALTSNFSFGTSSSPAKDSNGSKVTASTNNFNFGGVPAPSSDKDSGTNGSKNKFKFGTFPATTAVPPPSSATGKSTASPTQSTTAATSKPSDAAGSTISTKGFTFGTAKKANDGVNAQDAKTFSFGTTLSSSTPAQPKDNGTKTSPSSTSAVGGFGLATAKPPAPPTTTTTASTVKAPAAVSILPSTTAKIPETAGTVFGKPVSFGGSAAADETKPPTAALSCFPPASGLPAPKDTAVSKPVFGSSTAAPPSGSAAPSFGTKASDDSTAPAPTTGFGSSSSATPATGFGSSAATPATGFGSSSAAPATGLGGSSATPATGFGGSSATPAIGSAATPSTGFGSSSAPPSTGGFPPMGSIKSGDEGPKRVRAGVPTPQASTTPAPPPPGNNGSGSFVFGASSSQAGSTGVTGSSAAPPAASFNPGAFATSAPKTNEKETFKFGGSAPASASTTTFGAPPSTTPAPITFGAPSGNALGGAAAAPFGAAPAPFGAPAATGFGSNGGTTFGAPPASGTTFGATPAPVAGGMTGFGSANNSNMATPGFPPPAAAAPSTGGFGQAAGSFVAPNPGGFGGAAATAPALNGFGSAAPAPGGFGVGGFGSAPPADGGGFSAGTAKPKRRIIRAKRPGVRR